MADDGAESIGVPEVLAFLREKLADAEQHVLAREQAANVWSRGTTAEWRAAAAIHPSTRGKHVQTKKERLEIANRERRIGEKHRRDAALYRAAIAQLEGL